MTASKGGRSRSPAKLRACRQNAKKAAKARKLRRGVCRRCGCTDDAACGDPLFGCCTWADKSHTLCSACLNPKERKEFLNRFMNDPKPHPLEDWQQEIANDDRANPTARPELPPAAMLRLAAGEAAEWLRRGSPGRALEAIERGLTIFDNSKGW